MMGRYRPVSKLSLNVFVCWVKLGHTFSEIRLKSFGGKYRKIHVMLPGTYLSCTDVVKEIVGRILVVLQRERCWFKISWCAFRVFCSNKKSCSEKQAARDSRGNPAEVFPDINVLNGL